MADSKDKGEEGKPPGPAVPAIPRLTPAVPEPVDPRAPPARPPLAGVTTPPPSLPPVPLVPKMAPLMPPVAPRAARGTPTTSTAVPVVAPQRPAATAPAVPPVAPVLAAAPAAKTTPAPLADADAELERLFHALDELDYFEVMGLPSTAAPGDIKRAFHQLSRNYHPDRFFQSEDTALRGRVHAVYKRVTEAYFVLRDDARRKKYLQDVTGPDRLRKLRFDELAEAEAKAAVKKEVAEQIGTHPKGRQFFQVGVTDLEAGRLASAERNIKLALTFEPTNPLYLQKLEEARAKSYEEFKRSGKGFRIE